MLIVRAVILYIFLVITLIFYALLAGFLLVMPFAVRYQIITQWPRLMTWALKVICRLDYHVQGAENLPHYPVVIASKHQSAWETLSFQDIFCKPTWVLKRELLWIPFFGWGLRSIRPIAIDRSQRRQAMQQVLAQGIERLKAGHSVIIFPEGTRVAPGERKRYGLGAANLALAANVPIVPVAHNAGIFWRRNAFIKYPGTIQVVIGPPIQVEGKTAQAIMLEIETWIEETVQHLPKA
jgi:1-acyl-sn-glycerol-3-phosphate acyltransferase